MSADTLRNSCETPVVGEALHRCLPITPSTPDTPHYAGLMRLVLVLNHLLLLSAILSCPVSSSSVLSSPLDSLFAAGPPGAEKSLRLRFLVPAVPTAAQ